MVALIGTWQISAANNPEGWAKRYLEIHVPAVRRTPGLLRHVIGRTSDGAGGELWTAHLWFKDREAFAAAQTTAEFKAVPETGVMQDAENVAMTPLFDMDDDWRGTA